MKFCANCGSPLKDSAEYCEACGVKIKADALTDNIEVAQPTEPTLPISEEVEVPVEHAENSPVEEPADIHTEQPDVATEQPAPYDNAAPANEQTVCCVPKSYYQPTIKSASPTPLKVWAIIVLIISALETLICLVVPLPAIAVVLAVISLIAIGDSKVAISKQIFDHKLSTAKALNVVSTIIAGVSTLIVIVLIAVGSANSLIDDEKYKDDSYSSYDEEYYEDDFLEENPYDDYSDYSDYNELPDGIEEFFNRFMP